MILCGPAVASGSTARPPGVKESLASPTGKPPCEENGGFSSTEEEFLLGNSSALATNDRCVDTKEARCYAILIELMKEEVLRINNKESSPDPLDWKEIHGDDYEEYQEPLTPGHNNDKGDDDYLFDDYEELWKDAKNGSLCFPSIGSEDYIPQKSA